MESIVKIKVIGRDGELRIIEAPTDMNLNLMEALKINMQPVEGTCGGMALCASCHIYVREGNIEKPMSDDEQTMLDDVWNSESCSRLACQIPVTEALEDIVIELAPELVENNDDDW
jgi:ferredoxin-2, mitochondrial